MGAGRHRRAMTSSMYELMVPSPKSASPLETIVSKSPSPEAASDDGLRKRRPDSRSSFTGSSAATPRHGGNHIVVWGNKERGPHAPGRHTRRLTNDDLQEAVLRGDLRLVRELCLAGASVNAPLKPLCDAQYMSVLHIMACKPSVPRAGELIAFTIQQRADVDARSSFGATPLIFACLHKHVAAAEVLLQNGADKDAIDDYGRNALHGAMSLEHSMPGTDIPAASVQLVQMLHTFGADLSYGGITPPVTEGVLQGNDDAVSMLLELGAKAEGLHEAVNHSHIGVIKRLVDHEANPFSRDSKGMDVMEIAIARGDLEISNLIRDFMGKLERDKHPHLLTRKSREREESFERQNKGGKKDKVNASKVAPTQLQRLFLRLSHECRKVAKNGLFQKTMIVVLVMALFLPDIFVIFLIADQVVLDTAIIFIFVSFAIEYFVLVFGSWNSYVCSFYFWMDMLGMLSVPLDHSVVQDNLMPDHKGMDNSMLVRTTRMIRLGTRAGRFTKLVKLLRFLPGMGVDGDTGAAQGVSSRINGKISILVSCLIIVMIMLLPVFDLFRYPTDDLSMRVWVETLNDAVLNHEESLTEFITDIEAFYWDMDYFPLTFEANFPNGTTFQRTMERKVIQAPVRDADFLEFSMGSVTMVFNFETPNRAESIRNCVLIISILVFMTGAASNVSREVSTIVLKPLDELLGVVKKIASKIFTSVVQMSNSLSIMAANDDQSQQDESEEEEEEDVFRQETLLLQIVLKKLAALSKIMMSENPLNEDAYAKLDEKDREILECLTTAAAVSANEEYSALTVDRNLSYNAAEQLLANKSISVADIETWAMNVMDFTMEQTRTVALAIMVIDGDRVPPSDDDAIAEQYDSHETGVSQVWSPRSGSPAPARTGSRCGSSRGPSPSIPKADSSMDLLDLVVIPRAPPPPPEQDFGGGVRLETMTPLSAFPRDDSCTPHTMISAAGDQWQSSLSASQHFIHDVLAEYPTAESIPYHNWRHGIDVMFTVHRVQSMCSAVEWMTRNERFALSVSALAHDIAYPGVNNTFLIETSHEIALRYNDHSPNEYMHVSKLFEVANRPQRQIFKEMSQEDYRLIRYYCVESILNTDNMRHFSLLAEMQMLYDSERGVFDKSVRLYEKEREQFPSPDVLDILRDPAQKAHIRMSLLHFCDVSNPMKPWALCWVWANLCIEEFFMQGDKEKQIGIPVQPLNDRETVNVPYSQIGFIEFFVAPFVSLTAKMMPPMVSCEEFLWNNLDTWVEEWISKSCPDEEERDRVCDRVAKVKKGGIAATTSPKVSQPGDEKS